jgi:hypothetical protein
MIASEIKDLWGIYHHRQHLDPRDLTQAIEDQVRRGDLDYRTRLLIRESINALRLYWGQPRLAAWIEASPARQTLREICKQEFDDDVAFPSLRRRVMDVTRPETIRQYLVDLGKRVRRPIRIYIEGSIALILAGYLSRQTEDIDVVDEVPAEIRAQRDLLDDLKALHRLELAHFQRHYLAMGWEQRVHYYDTFDQLQVSLLDAYDVFLRKLFSARLKDRQDLKKLVPQLDKERIVQLLKDTCQSMMAAPGLCGKAEHNWSVFYGEALPT